MKFDIFENTIFEKAKNNGVLIWNYKTCTDNKYYTGAWEQEKFRTIYTYCLKASNEMNSPSDLDGKDILIASPGAVASLETMEQFQVTKEYNTDVLDVDDIEDVDAMGKIGRYIVYRNLFATSDYIVVCRTVDGTVDTVTDSRLVLVEGLACSGIG